MTEEELLKEAEGYGELLFGVDQLAFNLGVKPERIRIALSTADDPLGIAIRTGRFRSEAELRRSILKLAKQGSSPAQEMAVRLIQQMDQ